MSRLKAFRFSGRFNKTRRTRSSRLVSKFPLIDLDLHAEQRGSKRFALRVHAQRNSAAAAERLAHHEIQRAEIRQLVPLDAAFDQAAEERSSPAIGGHFAQQNRIKRSSNAITPIFDMSPFIAGTGMCQPREQDLHSTTSTRGFTSLRGINAGQ